MLAAKNVNLTILEENPDIINKIASSNKDYKKNLTFEIPLGSSNKLVKLQKSRLNASIYVPYGKDWIPYFINRLAEGRIRKIAVALLNGKKADIDKDAKNREKKETAKKN
jgi:hypothetical protein